MYQKFINYIKETQVEMRKVNWPTRRETIRFTSMVIVISLIVSAVLGGFDYIFQILIKLII